MKRATAAEQRGLGARGETLAARFLEARGVRVVARNVRLPIGELDLIGQDGDGLVFVEVKTRLGDAETAPDVAVTEAKLQRLERLAGAYLECEGMPDASWRLDVIAVVLGRDGRVISLDHLEGAYL